MGFSNFESGAILAAMIAASASVLGLIISKEQKTSEFRQSWIDSLRKETARIVAHANAIHGAGVAGFETAKDMWIGARSDFIEINNAAARIRLRLSHTESSSLAVINTLEKIEKILAPGKIIQSDELDAAELELVKTTQTVLRQEWTRVKRGEPAYRWAIAAAVILFVMTTTLFLIGYTLPASEVGAHKIQGTDANATVTIHVGGK
jgi:hypothetical protein